ncbi:hypothetical protein ELF35_24775 [Salmonella enterica]|nr:hypothetical protein [Salmonella enterica]EAW2074801.1 hypothetical protein [Salmonella enterica subsp. enterica]EBD0229179.1 hypothetical protein [Salmonella enterica subsp. enterica serovar Heidelberg]EBI0474064.1 hypothetical protein [Salmonella enterica subsp. enterica serovar Amager]EFB9766438.1 hypothetical protein [Escherichia coli]
MNIQHPTEQANRPATGVVTDKGVPQSDSFAKYAALDVRLPEQFSIIGKLRAHYPVVTLCHVLKWSTKTGHRVRVFPVSIFRFVWG